MSSTLQTLAAAACSTPAAPFCAFPSPNPFSPDSSTPFLSASSVSAVSSAWDYTASHPRGGCIRLKCTDGDLWYWWNKLNEKCSTIAAQPDADHIDVPFPTSNVDIILKYLDTAKIDHSCGTVIQLAEWLGFQAYTTAMYGLMVKMIEPMLKHDRHIVTGIVVAIQQTNRYNTREFLFRCLVENSCALSSESGMLYRHMWDIVNAGLTREYPKQVKLTQEFAVFLKQTNVFPPPDFTRIDNSEITISPSATEKKRPAVEDISPDAKRVNPLDLDGVTVTKQWSDTHSKRTVKEISRHPKCIEVYGGTQCTTLETRSPKHRRELVEQLYANPTLYEELARRMGFTL